MTSLGNSEARNSNGRHSVRDQQDETNRPMEYENGGSAATLMTYQPHSSNLRSTFWSKAVRSGSVERRTIGKDYRILAYI